MVLFNDCMVVYVYVYYLAVLTRSFDLWSVVVAGVRGGPCIVAGSSVVWVVFFGYLFLCFLVCLVVFYSLSFCGSCLVVGV